MAWTPAPGPGRLRRAPVQQRSAERLNRILDACAAQLDEAGYEAMSTRAVADRADVPIGSVYRFFGNKRAMADALGQRNLDRYAERIAGRIATVAHDDWRAAVDAALEEYLAMKRTVPGFALVDFAGPVQAPSEANHLVADRLADLLADHLGRPLDTGLRRSLLVSVEAADALLRLAFRVRPEGDTELVAETRALLHAYLARTFD